MQSDTWAAWWDTWREARYQLHCCFAPQWSDRQVRGLAAALRDPDSPVFAGSTVSPPALDATADWPVEAACPVVHAGVVSGEVKTPPQAEDFLARSCHVADEVSGEYAGCRHLLGAIDDLPEDVMRLWLAWELEDIAWLRTKHRVRWSWHKEVSR